MGSSTGMPSGDRPQVYAVGDGVLSSGTRDAGRECLTLASEDYSNGPFATWPADSPPVLLNHTEQPGRRAILIYQAQSSTRHSRGSSTA